MRWFGPAWEAPLCHPAREVPTPIGSVCVFCGFLVTWGDQGVLVPHDPNTPTRPSLRPVAPWTSVYHLLCVGGELGLVDLEPHSERLIEAGDCFGDNSVAP